MDCDLSHSSREVAHCCTPRIIRKWNCVRGRWVAMRASEEVPRWEKFINPLAKAIDFAFGCYHTKMSRVLHDGGRSYRVGCDAELISIIPSKHVDCSATRHASYAEAVAHTAYLEAPSVGFSKRRATEEAIAIVFHPSQESSSRCGARRQRYAGKSVPESIFSPGADAAPSAARVGRLRLYAGAQLLE